VADEGVTVIAGVRTAPPGDRAGADVLIDGGLTASL
jgi:hypothetical protein